MVPDWRRAFVAGRAEFGRRNRLEERLWRGQHLTDEEIRGLSRACQAGLASFADEGTVLVTHFHTVKRYQIYAHYDGGRARPGRAWTWSWQEAFTQLAFATELVLDHDWHAGHVALEVDRLDVAAGEHPLTAPLILAEVKLRDGGPQGLQAMLSVFEELSGGQHAVTSVGVRSNAVPKFDGLLRLRPKVFVAVAPGVRHQFDVAYRDEVAVLTPRRLGITPNALLA